MSDYQQHKYVVVAALLHRKQKISYIIQMFSHLLQYISCCCMPVIHKFGGPCDSVTCSVVRFSEMVKVRISEQVAESDGSPITM